MFEKVKQRKEERARIVREKAEAEERQERERIQAEKDALMTLSEKELMIEAILILKGFNTRLDKIEQKQNSLEDSISSLDFHMYSLDSSVDELREK